MAEMKIPIELIKKDLTKTLGVTILALILQIALMVYLNKSGWQIILNKF